MKFPFKNVTVKKFPKGLIVKEFQNETNPFPIDGCIVEYNNDGYPWKKT